MVIVLSEDSFSAGSLIYVVSAWRTLDLSSKTLSSLAKLEFSVPTAIQLAAIPEILSGHDVIGKASTGSGYNGPFQAFTDALKLLVARP